MSFIRGNGQWGYISGTLSAGTQAYVSFGFGDAPLQQTMQADLFYIAVTAADTKFAFGSQSANLTNANAWGVPQALVEYQFSPAGLNSQGFTISGSAACNYRARYFYPLPVEAQRDW
jgi:hypothetical protein